MISTTRKSRLPSAIVVAAAIAGLGVAHAQYPERGLTLIVPYGAGGGTDITARLLARDLEMTMGASVTVENRAGGGLKVAVRQASVGPCLQKRGRVSRSAIVFVGAVDG